jgi:hypothetical protein
MVPDVERTTCPHSLSPSIVELPNPPSQDASFLDRMRERFLRGQTESHQDEPEQKWIAITVCILIALLLWFTLTMQESYTASFDLPTRIINLPNDTALTALPPSRVRVQVRGEGFQLLQLRYNPTAVPINASVDRVDLEAIGSQLPKGLILETVNPRQFDLRKEPRITRQIPIRLHGEIETPATYDLMSPPQLSPDSVVVSGARSIVNDLSAWPTEPFRVEALRDSLVDRVALKDTLDGLVRLEGTTTTTVTAVARPFTEGSREIDVEVTGVPTTERFVRLDPSTVRVRYRVPLSQYEAAQQVPDFFATVSYEQIRADTTGRIRPEVHLPEDMVLRDVSVLPPVLGYYEVLVDE